MRLLKLRLKLVKLLLPETYIVLEYWKARVRFEEMNCCHSIIAKGWLNNNDVLEDL